MFQRRITPMLLLKRGGVFARGAVEEGVSAFAVGGREREGIWRWVWRWLVGRRGCGRGLAPGCCFADQLAAVAAARRKGVAAEEHWCKIRGPAL